MLKGTKGKVAVLLGKQEQRSQNNPNQTAQRTISIPLTQWICKPIFALRTNNQQQKSPGLYSPEIQNPQHLLC